MFSFHVEVVYIFFIDTAATRLYVEMADNIYSPGDVQMYDHVEMYIGTE